MEAAEPITKKDMKVEISAEIALPAAARGGGGAAASGSGGLARQGSINKNMNCLCSPTTHAGSFRCRLHRAPIGLQRTKSLIYSTALHDSQTKPNQTAQMLNHGGGTVEAQ